MCLPLRTGLSNSGMHRNGFKQNRCDLKRKNHADKSTHKLQWQIDCIDMKTVNQTTQRIEEKRD